MTRKIRLDWSNFPEEASGDIPSLAFDIPTNRSDLLHKFDNFADRCNEEKCALYEAWWGYPKMSREYCIETYRKLRGLSWDELFNTINPKVYSEFVKERRGTKKARQPWIPCQQVTISRKNRLFSQRMSLKKSPAWADIINRVELWLSKCSGDPHSLNYGVNIQHGVYWDLYNDLLSLKDIRRMVNRDRQMFGYATVWTSGEQTYDLENLWRMND